MSNPGQTGVRVFFPRRKPRALHGLHSARVHDSSEAWTPSEIKREEYPLSGDSVDTRRAPGSAPAGTCTGSDTVYNHMDCEFIQDC